MEVRELRVGSLLLYGTKHIVVSSIEIDVNSFEYVVCCANDECYNLYQLKPIPLTEEWLLNNGALRMSDNEYFFSRFLFIWKEEYKFWYVMNAEGNCYMTKIEFVHEWQNFMFVMNGQELELKSN